MAFDPDAPAPPGSGIFGLPHTPDEARVVIVPVPWDATTSYRAGTSRGPAAILAASHQVDLHDVEHGRPYEQGIAMLDLPDEVEAWNREARALAEPILESGGSETAGLDRVNAYGDQLNAWVLAEVERWRARGKIVGLLGGDHSAPYGAIEACAKKHPGVGVLHVDAHADLRQAYEGFTWSHASIMWNVATRLPNVSRLVQVGIRDVGEAEVAFSRASNGRVVTWFEPDLAARRFEGEAWGAQVAEILEPLPYEVYVSFDIDGLDPAYCPHTGTPVPGGLSFAQATYLLRALVKSGRKVVGFDLNEVAPGDDPEDEWDANVGARLLYKLIGAAVAG
jgi:agmatinase